MWYHSWVRTTEIKENTVMKLKDGAVSEGHNVAINKMEQLLAWFFTIVISLTTDTASNHLLSDMRFRCYW